MHEPRRLEAWTWRRAGVNNLRVAEDGQRAFLRIVAAGKDQIAAIGIRLRPAFLLAFLCFLRLASLLGLLRLVRGSRSCGL